MAHSTSSTLQPSQKSLLFITTFARLYVPQTHNESLARNIAQQTANTSDEPYKHLS